MSGALAVAGSTLNFVKINGSNIPITLPAITINIIVIISTTVISGARNEESKATPIAIVIPSNKDTKNSLPNSLTSL